MRTDPGPVSPSRGRALIITPTMSQQWPQHTERLPLLPTGETGQELPVGRAEAA
jgi:hypothetical protein